MAPVPDRARLEELGFFACEPDLEGELIRALGTTVVEAVIEEQGELTSWHILQRQPAQLTRSVEDQLHRFLGTRSGRKETYARLLVEALDLDRIPHPCSRCCARCEPQGSRPLAPRAPAPTGGSAHVPA